MTSADLLPSDLSTPGEEDPPLSGPVEVTIPPDLAGQRLDRVLPQLLPSVSRGKIRLLIERAQVTRQGGIVATGKRKVLAGETYALTLPEDAAPLPQPEAVPLSILDEDEHLIVLYKPPGLVVHPSTGHAEGTLVNALLHHTGGRLSTLGGIERPGIVHRLDKETSGLMVVAKTDDAHLGLKAQFADRSLSRGYRAVVLGLPQPAEGRIEAPIGRKPFDRLRMAVVAEGQGKPAATRWQTILAFGPYAAMVLCSLETGRTHQVRVHMAHLGHPLIGDPLYLTRIPPMPDAMSRLVQDFPRQALHAETLRFIHPMSGEPRSYQMPPPSDLQDLVEALNRAWDQG